MTKPTRKPWSLREDGTQKTMGEMTRQEQNEALAPIIEDLKKELAATLPKLLKPAKGKLK